MLKCTLFGREVTFHDQAERFFDLQHAGWAAQNEARKRFLNWYDKCGNIECVLREYKGFAQNILNNLAVQPLFNTLRQHDIYDVSKDAYPQAMYTGQLQLKSFSICAAAQPMFSTVPSHTTDRYRFSHSRHTA